MASHSEVAIGSVGEWVVRLEGKDVPVAVLSKTRDPSGRGYDFMLQRVGSDGQPYGRSLKRGSGALRRPGVAARAFGGGYQARQPVPVRRNGMPISASSYSRDGYASMSRVRGREPVGAPEIMAVWPDEAPARRATPRRAPPVQATVPPAAPTSSPTGSAASSAALPSLRGRGRASGSSSPKLAPARTAPKPASPAAGSLAQVIQALQKLPPQADDYMIRNAVAEVLSRARAQLYYPHTRR